MFRINNKIAKLLICLKRKKKEQNYNFLEMVTCPRLWRKKTEKHNLLSAINVNICKNVTKCSNLVIISFYKSLRLYQFFWRWKLNFEIYRHICRYLSLFLFYKQSEYFFYIDIIHIHIQILHIIEIINNLKILKSLELFLINIFVINLLYIQFYMFYFINELHW